MVARKRKRGGKKNALHSAVIKSRQFYGFEPRHLRRLNVEWPKAATKLGEVVQIDYLSDKFDGQVKRYFHKFAKPPVLLAAPNRAVRGQWLLLVVGEFKVKHEGITG